MAKTFNAGLTAYKNNRANKVAFGIDLYTITLVNGTVLRYSGGDAPVPNGPGGSFALGPLFTRSKISYKYGLQTSQMDLKIAPRGSLDMIGSIPLFDAFRAGLFSGAVIVLQVGIAAQPLTTPFDYVTRFRGLLGAAHTDLSGGQFTVNNSLYLLDSPFPRNVYSPNCGNTLFDSICKLNPLTYSTTGQVAAAIDQMSFTVSGPVSPMPANHYQFGRLEFLTGRNAGLTQSVKSNTTTTVVFSKPWPYAPIASDGFRIYQGCDKKQSTCTTKFSNLVNFRGEPAIPVAVTIA